MGLTEDLLAISAQLKEQRHLINTEEATKTVSIRPFIKALGYDTYNLNEVQPEFVADPRAKGGERVDYAIMRDGKPIILVEAKAADVSLNENHWRQLHDYFGAVEVEFGILTNGIEYRLYTDHERRHVMDREPFLTIDMLKPDAVDARALEGFTKTRFDPEQTARKLKIFSLVKREYHQPSEEFVKYFAKQVHTGSVFQKTIQAYTPIVRQAWRDLVDMEIASRLQRRDEEDDANGKDDDGEQNPPPPEPPDYIEISVFGMYKGNRFEAKLLFSAIEWKKSAIRFGGNTFKISPSTLHVIRTVNPTLTNQQNGWSFWKLRDPDGNHERSIGDLRRDDDLVRRLQAKS